MTAAKKDMEKTKDDDAVGIESTALFALAAGWDAQSKRLFAEAKERWHLSDNLDLEHQAKVFRQCSAELQKLIRANAEAQATAS